jgi:hypothetical protein
MIPQLTDKLGFIGVKKIDANAQKKIEEIIESAVGTQLKTPSAKDMKDIFELKTGNDYGTVPLIQIDKINPVVRKVIFHFYNTYDFFKYMVNYTKYRIKIEFTRDSFQMLTPGLIGNEYREELLKELGMKSDEQVSKAVTNIERGINLICGTGKNGKESVNLQANGTISDIIHFNIFKLLQIMMMEENTYQQNFNQLKSVDKR